VHAAVLHWQYSHVPPAGIIQIPAGLLVRLRYAYNRVPVHIEKINPLA